MKTKSGLTMDEVQVEGGRETQVKGTSGGTRRARREQNERWERGCANEGDAVQVWREADWCRNAGGNRTTGDCKGHHKT